MFQYNIFFVSNSFYKRCFNFQLLANAFVPNNIKAAVKLQTSVAKQRYLLPLLNERQCTDTVIFYSHFFSFLLLLSYETKYHSSQIY